MDRVARELELDPRRGAPAQFHPPEQMPYEVGLTFRDGKPLVYDSGDYPACQEKALAARATTTASASARRRRAARAAIIGIGIANYVEGTGLGPFEGVTVRVLPNGKVAVATGAHQPGPGHTHDALADRRRQARLPHRGHRDDDRRHRRRSRRASARSRAGRRSMPAPRRTSPAMRCATRSSRSRRARSTSPRERHRCRGRPGDRARAATSRRIALRRSGARWRRACRAFSLPAGQAAGPRTHRLFHAAAGRLLQRHPCRRGRGRCR